VPDPYDNEFTEPEESEPKRSRNRDDDVPFHLPMVGEEEEDDDETGDIPLLSHIPTEEEKFGGVRPKHEMPTMPIPREPGSTDPKKTLQGSGGLDPNPDFNRRSSLQNTAVHQPVQPTMVNARPASPPRQGPPPPPAGASRPVVLPPRPRKRRGFLGIPMGCLVLIIGTFATFCGGLTLLTLATSAIFGARIERELSARVAAVDDYHNFESTFYYDRHGTQLYEAFNEGRRTNIDISNIPDSLIKATLAIEDDNFYTNPGIDVPATLRAFLQYVGLSEGSTGGSTITQQLVRTLLFDPEYRMERSPQRKLEEIGLALVLTQRKSKDEILELYLNEIYYGNLAYGAAAAARTFFDKDVSELTVGEAALLAGLPQAPASLDPLNPDPSVQAAVEMRWRTVLDRMVTEGYITDSQRNDILRQGLVLKQPDVPFRAPHFTVFAQNELEQLMTSLGYDPEEITRGGLKVYTTLDLRINDMAQTAVVNQISRLAGNNVSNGAVVVLKPVTGEILAMVGSADYNNDAIDGRVNVAISPRQPGSTMKPFTYASAIELGMSPAEVLWDTPLKITGPGVPPNWPRNYDGRYHGPMRMRQALANSYNIPAVSTLRRIGVPNLLAIMQRFGVRSLGNDASRYGLSLTLGGGEVTLLELTRAYSVFANQGSYVQTTSILCVLNSKDEIIYEYEDSCPRGRDTERTTHKRGFGTQVLDPRIAFLISDILGDNAARTPAMGANSPLYTPSILSSVKTGTTDDVKDNWTVGYTRNVAVGVWVGNSNGDPMVNSSGLTGAAPIWNSVINGIYSNTAFLGSFATNGQLLNDQIQPPAGLNRLRLCDVSRMIDPVINQCGATVDEWVLASPAGRPLPDGGMDYPPAQPAPQQQPVTSGPNLVEVEPDIYRVLAQRIPAHLATFIQFQVPVGQAAPPPPIYCQVPVELGPTALSTGAQEQLFIAPPDVPEEAIEAENFARGANLAFLPTIQCDPSLLQGSPQYGAPVVTAVITSPPPGAVLTEETPIIGTVQFSPDQAMFYKVEVVGGPFPDWVTIGTTHTENVVNGQLENLYVPGLTSGNYRLRLVLVDNTGGFLQAPYEVPFSVP
jgi:penicillin-binding protein 1C